MTEISRKMPVPPTRSETGEVISNLKKTEGAKSHGKKIDQESLEKMAEGSFVKTHEDLFYKKVLSFFSFKNGGSTRDKNKEKLAELLRSGPFAISKITVYVDYKANITKGFKTAMSIGLAENSNTKAEVFFTSESDGYECVLIPTLKRASMTALPNNGGSKVILPLCAIKTIEFE